MRNRRRRGVYASRTGQRGPATRLDRASEARRERAQAHLRRVRGHAAAPARGRPRRRPALWAALVLAGGALFGGAVVAWGAAGHLRAIHVSGATRLSPAEVAAATGVSPGATWSSVVPEAVTAQLESHDWIASATALRIPPATLLVEIQERVPLAAARNPGGELWLVDGSGTPFAPATRETAERLPLLVPATRLVRDAADPALAEAVRLAHSLLDHGLALPAEVRLAADGDPEGYVLRLAGRGARVVLGREDLDARVADLARLLAADAVEAYRGATFDLRFADQAVLRQLPSPTGEAQEAAARGGATPSNRRSSG